MSGRRFWLSFALSSTLGSVSIPATADERLPAQAPPKAATVTCDFIEIAATKGKGASVDPALGPVEKKLKKAPFSTQWSEFKQLSTTSKKLDKKKTETFALKQGSVTATLLETVDQQGARLNVTIESPKGKKAVDNTSVMSAADYVIYTIVQSNGDGHLVAVTCR
jgi:hypothetical protein